MALTNAQARTKWLGPFKNAYARALVFRMLTNRRFQGDAQDAYELTLNTTTTSFSATETDRRATRAPALPQAQTSAKEQATLTMRWIHQHSMYERDLDLLEGPADTMPVVMRDGAYALAKASDNRTRTIILAGVPDAQDAASTAGYRLGDSTDYVSNMGAGSTKAARVLFPDLIRRIGHIFRANDWWKLGAPNYDEAQPYILTDNAMATAMGEYIDKDKPSERLVNEFVRSDGVRVGGVFGTWKDIPIVVTNSLPLLSISSKDYHQVLVHSPAAVTAAYRNPSLEFNQGVVYPNIGGTLTRLFGWTGDGEAVMGASVVNPELLHRFAIRAEA